MELSANQESAIRHGLHTTDPRINYTVTAQGITIISPSGMHINVTVHDGGVRMNPEYSNYMRCREPDHPSLDSVAGYCEIYQRTALVEWDPRIKNDSLLHPRGAIVPVLCSPLLWFYEQHTHGGATGSVGYRTREDALADLTKHAWERVQLWETKVRYRNNGDMTTASKWGLKNDKPRPVIRCKGIHYTIGPESTSYTNRGLLGHGGHRFRFRMLDTGDIITSHNVWNQGRIPVEYRELLPDNAEDYRED